MLLGEVCNPSMDVKAPYPSMDVKALYLYPRYAFIYIVLLEEVSIVGSMDVKALYPSIEIKLSVEKCGNSYVKATLNSDKLT